MSKLKRKQKQRFPFKIEIMENKYYTPNIEEFHAGFEIESQNIENAQWGKYVVQAEDIHSIEEEGVEYTRVKYLDREDIESLGFTYEIENKGEKEVRLTDKDRGVSVTWSKEKGMVWIGAGKPTMVLVFSGKVKNKSELKRILGQTILSSND